MESTNPCVSASFWMPLEIRGDLGAPVNEVTIQGELEWVEITGIKHQEHVKRGAFYTVVNSTTYICLYIIYTLCTDI